MLRYHMTKSNAISFHCKYPLWQDNIDILLYVYN